MITKDIINVIGYNIIQDSIIDEVKRAGFYSVLADHMSSHNDQYLPIFLHFVDDSCEKMEEFIHFAKLERVIAPDIANAIAKTLLDVGMSLNDLQGQGYNGVSTIISEFGICKAKLYTLITLIALVTHLTLLL